MVNWITPAPTTAIGQGHHSNCFDLIRLLAASGVLFSHSFALLGLPEPTFYGGETLGSLSVFVFFAVSGYLVLGSWDRSKNSRSFIVNRSLRIFPGLIVCLLLCAFVLGPLVTTISGADYFSDVQPYKFVFANINMFGDRSNTLPGVFSTNPFPNSVNGSLWTIRYEIFMYITLFAVVTAFRKSTHLIILVLLLYIGLWTIGKLAKMPDPGDLLWRLGSIGLSGKILKLAPFFLIGVLIARLPKSVLRPSIAFIFAFEAYFFRDSVVTIVMLWVTLPYCVLVLAYHAPNMFNQFGKHGDFSYGVYLYAFPVQQTVSYVGVQTW